MSIVKGHKLQTALLIVLLLSVGLSLFSIWSYPGDSSSASMRSPQQGIRQSGGSPPGSGNAQNGGGSVRGGNTQDGSGPPGNGNALNGGSSFNNGNAASPSTDGPSTLSPSTGTKPANNQGRAPVQGGAGRFGSAVGAGTASS
jgi:hypothetical protein